MLQSAARSILLTILLLSPATLAHADGVFVWRNQDIDIREPQQKALIVHEDGIQDLVLSVKFEGAVEDFGWLVPIPSRPEMAVAEGQVFETLSRAMQTPFISRSRTFAGLTETLGAGSLTELRVTQHDVGIYDIALLEGGDGRALETWLTRHGYLLPNGAEAVFDEYAAMQWTIAAIKIDPDQIDVTTDDDLKSGEIDPIHFRFATVDPVFPLRISSLGGHPSEVLLYVLADRPRRPASKHGVSWTVYLQPWQTAVRHIRERYWAEPGNDPTVYHLPKPPPSFMRDLYGRFFDRTEQLWLTQCRATIAPEAMVDLAFVDHEVTTALTAEEMRTKVEAISYLGQTGDTSAVPLLIKVLAGRQVPQDDCTQFLQEHREGLPPGQHFRSALWALGVLGDCRAVPEVQRWADSGQPLYQIDALEALRLLDPSAATAVSLNIVELGDRISMRDHCMRRLHALARTTIVEFGGAQLLPRLADLIDRDLDLDLCEATYWRDEYANPELGPDAVAMAAACGDTTARALLEKWLTEIASSWCRGLADGDSTGTKGTYNSYPGILYPLSHVAAGSKFNDRQPRSAAVLKTLRDRPEIRDEILREVAAIDTLSGLSRAILLSELTMPDKRDVGVLNQLWQAARDNPRRVQIEFPGSRHGRTCPLWVNFDLDAFTIAYALAKLGEESLLLSFWRQVPWSEAELRGEILAALIRMGSSDTRSPMLYAAMRDYLRRIWNVRIRELDRAGCYAAESAGRRGWPYPLSFEPPHRERIFASLLRGRATMQGAELIEDVTLDLAVRFYWFQQSWAWLHFTDPDRLDQHLRHFSSRLQDPHLVAACDWIVHRVEELRTRDTAGNLNRDLLDARTPASRATKDPSGWKPRPGDR